MNRNQEIRSFWIMGLTSSQKMWRVTQNKESHCSVTSFLSPLYRNRHANKARDTGFDLSKLWRFLHNRKKALGLKWLSGHYLTLHIDDLSWPCTSQTSPAHLYSASIDSETLQDQDPLYALLEILLCSLVCNIGSTERELFRRGRGKL